jgi:hypothetical protein
MAQVPALGHDYWKTELDSLRTEFKDLVRQHLDAREAVGKVLDVFNDIIGLAGNAPKSIGENEAWTRVVRRAEANWVSLRMVLEGKTLFGALCGVYSLALIDLKAVLKRGAAEKRSHTPTAGSDTPATNTTTTPRSNSAVAPTAQDEGEFRSQKRRKRINSSEEVRPGPSKRQSSTERKGTAAGQPAVRNYFAPLRTMEMEEDASTGKGTESEPPTQQQTTGK